MNSIDKISRDAKILVDSAKDNTTKNLIEAVQGGLIDLNQDQLEKILDVLSTSFDMGYQRSLPVFQNMIKKHVTG